MPLTAAEQRARRLAEQRRRVSSAQRVDQRSRVSSAQHAARRDDSDSDGADDAFTAEASDDARSPAASPGGSRSDSDNSNDGPGAALSDSAMRLLFTGLLCCGIASVHSSCCTTVACMHPPQPQPHHLMHVRARFPCRISSCSRMQRCRPTAAHCCQGAASVLARRRASGGRHRGRLCWQP